MIDQLLQKIDSLLKNANFETFLLDNFTFKKNKFCFDLLVKKDDLVFSVKVFPNIDNISLEIINDIKSLSLILKSKPILIGVKNRYQKLEENTIYIREDLPFISFKTLENILSRNQYPYILAKRGGGIVFLNGNLIFCESCSLAICSSPCFHFSTNSILYYIYIKVFKINLN